MMAGTSGIDTRLATKPRRGLVRLSVCTVLALLIGALVAANVQLVTLAFDSQPDCVPHTRTGNAEQGLYRAAKPVCDGTTWPSSRTASPAAAEVPAQLAAPESNETRMPIAGD